jgi:hypothetical protein
MITIDFADTKEKGNDLIDLIMAGTTDPQDRPAALKMLLMQANTHPEVLRAGADHIGAIYQV